MATPITIGKKLMLCFSGAFLLLVGLAYSSWLSNGTMGDALDTALNKTAKKSQLAGQIEASAAYLKASQQSVILYSLLKQPEMAERSKELFATHTARIKKAAAEMKPLLVSASGRQLVTAIESKVNEWQPLWQRILELTAAGRFQEINSVVAQTDSLADQLQEACAQSQQNQRSHLAESAKEGAEASSRSRWIAIVLIGICLAVGGVVLLVVRDVSVTLRQLAAEMSEGAWRVSGAAAQVASFSQSLAQGASEQAASIEETSATSEEINSMARKNTENSRAAALLVTKSQQRFLETNQSLEQMLVAMGEINASSDKISRIIKVIDEIAFQTNILALNAAVEAARAGEAGMGFAVVADEVRNLAQRCAQAAKDTEALIQESINKSSDGKNKVDQVASAIHSITEESSKVKTLVDEVSVGSEEQARGIDHIGSAILQMEQVTQKAAANAEESASAAEELNGQSDLLKDIVQRLILIVGGGQSAGAGHGRDEPTGEPALLRAER
jgi:methyl-accepting chemotaxis protein/methyl-accepting chemotaxis protein-1 (serine sensor receptor)